MDLLDVIYHLSQVPTWIGWTFATGGLCAGAWLIGRSQRD